MAFEMPTTAAEWTAYYETHCCGVMTSEEIAEAVERMPHAEKLMAVARLTLGPCETARLRL